MTGQQTAADAPVDAPPDAPPEAAPVSVKMRVRKRSGPALNITVSPLADDDWARWQEMALALAAQAGQCVTILACVAGECQEMMRFCPPDGGSNGTANGTASGGG